MRSGGQLLGLFILLFVTTPAFAGYAVPSVRVCGKTTFYMRYSTIPAPAIRGNSSNGLSNELFRLDGILLIHKNLAQPAQRREAAIVEFDTAIQTPGVSLCATGDLDVSYSKRDPSVAILTFRPETFEILERPADYTSASEIAKRYYGTMFVSASPIPGMAQVAFRIAPDSRDGGRLASEDLHLQINSRLPMYGFPPCSPLLDATFALVRRDRHTLVFEGDVGCENKQHPAALKIRGELTRNTASIEAVYMPENIRFSFILVDGPKASR